jgi:regulator of replication initiation timing
MDQPENKEGHLKSEIIWLNDKIKLLKEDKNKLRLEVTTLLVKIDKLEAIINNDQNKTDQKRMANTKNREALAYSPGARFF